MSLHRRHHALTWPLFVVLLAASALLVGCDSRPAVGAEDGAVGADAGAQADLAPAPRADLAPPPRADLATTGLVTVVLDKAAYGVSETAVATVINGSAETIWLEGCSILTRELEQAGAWVDRGPDLMCGWAGYARPVAAGATLQQDVRFSEPGRWRVALTYGVGCDPKRPLDPQACQRMERIHSAPAAVQPTLADCNGLELEYTSSLDFARRCNGAINTPQCTKMVGSSLYCGCPTMVDNDAQLVQLTKRWQDWKCFALMPPCGIKCAAPAPSACLGDRCVPMGD